MSYKAEPQNTRSMKPKVLQEILGHSDISITMNTYVTIQEDEKRRQMHMFDLYVKKSNLAQKSEEIM